MYAKQLFNGRKKIVQPQVWPDSEIVFLKDVTFLFNTFNIDTYIHSFSMPIVDR